MKQILGSEPNPSEQILIQGKAFTLPSNYIEGAGENIELTIQPQVVAINDESGKPLTLKLVHNLSSSIADPITGEKVDKISIGSFGQNDLIRMWFASIYTSDILSIPDYLDTKLEQAKFFYGENAKIRLDELLYFVLNVSFFANFNRKYPKGNVYGSIKWKTPPAEILSEINRRISTNETVNYQYLGFLIEQGLLDGLIETEVRAKILKKAEDEMAASTRHKIAMVKGEFGLDTNPIYDTLISKLMDLDLNIDYKGITILDNSIKSFLEEGELNLDNRLVSSNPVVNFADLIIGMVINVLSDSVYNTGPLSNHSAIPLVADHAREILTRRIYEMAKDELGSMSLGEFASQVYALRLNNTDSNLSEYLYSRDDSHIRISQYLATREF